MTSAKVGDRFYASWGYDQTNIDFVQIIELSKTGKTAICKMMSKQQTDNMHVAPGKAFGVTFRLKVKTCRDEPELVGTYPFVQRDNEVRGTRFDYFWPYKEKPVYETPWNMGH